MTILTENNFRFVILRTINLARTGFCDFKKKNLNNLKFCAQRPLNIRVNTGDQLIARSGKSYRVCVCVRNCV